MSTQQYTLEELSKLTNTTLVGDPSHSITGVADLETAQSGDASFLANPRYLSAMKSSGAGVVFIDKEMAIEEGRNFLVAENPSEAFQTLVRTLFTAIPLTRFEGIHPTAIIHETAKLGANVSVGPYAVVDANVTVGDNTHIGAQVFLGPQVQVGNDSIIHPQVVVREGCIIGNRVILQPSVVIGSCGYGYLTDAAGKHNKLEQLGRVVIEDDVEIGANTTIDRARFQETRIGKGTKIDNLVLVGHGANIGTDNLLVGQCAIAGSSKTGKHVIVGGQSAITGHVSLCDGAILTARSGASKNFTEPGLYSGVPALPAKQYRRQQVFVRQIEKLIKRIDTLEKKG